jgi:hypothetical protein
MYAGQCSCTTRMVRNTSIKQHETLLTLYRATLSKSEKLNYIGAVQCLGKKPARTPAAIAAGAKSRYDDFVVTHIQQTRTIHFTVRRVSMAWFVNADFLRATFSRGIATLCGLTNKHSATSADTKVPIRTITGPSTLTHGSRRCSMAARPVYRETEYSFPGETTPACPPRPAASYVSSLRTVGVVSARALSKTGRSIWDLSRLSGPAFLPTPKQMALATTHAVYPANSALRQP